MSNERSVAVSVPPSWDYSFDWGVLQYRPVGTAVLLNENENEYWSVCRMRAMEMIFRVWSL